MTTMSTEGVPYIGSRISLTSKSDIRYEGVLFTIDTNESTVALKDVRSFGTETRPRAFIPPSPEIYEFIVFKGPDIADLHVMAAPTALPPQATLPPQAALPRMPPTSSAAVPTQPALPSDRQPAQHQQALAQQPQHAPVQPQQRQVQQPPQQPPAVPLYGGGARAWGPPPPRPGSSAARGAPAVQPARPVQPPKAPTQAAVAPPNGAPPAPPANGVANGQATAWSGEAQHHQQTGGRSSGTHAPQGVSQDDTLLQQHFPRGQAANPRQPLSGQRGRGRGRGGGHQGYRDGGRRRQRVPGSGTTRGPGIAVPSEDFDFDAMNRKFEKVGLNAESEASVVHRTVPGLDAADGVGAPVADSQDALLANYEPKYDKATSFFDDLGPPPRERETPHERAQRRHADFETFGETYIPRGYRSGGRRGGGRRGGRRAPYGRGGRHHGSHHNGPPHNPGPGNGHQGMRPAGPHAPGGGGIAP